MPNDEPMQPFYEYLKIRRQALLTELDQIERLLGTSPRTAEIRKRINAMSPATIATGNYSGIVSYERD